MRMVALLPAYLLSRDYRWIVFTATSAVRGILRASARRSWSWPAPTARASQAAPDQLGPLLREGSARARRLPARRAAGSGFQLRAPMIASDRSALRRPGRRDPAVALDDGRQAVGYDELDVAGRRRRATGSPPTASASRCSPTTASAGRSPTSRCTARPLPCVPLPGFFTLGADSRTRSTMPASTACSTDDPRAHARTARRAGSAAGVSGRSGLAMFRRQLDAVGATAAARRHGQGHLHLRQHRRSRRACASARPSSRPWRDRWREATARSASSGTCACCRSPRCSRTSPASTRRCSRAPPACCRPRPSPA